MSVNLETTPDLHARARAARRPLRVAIAWQMSVTAVIALVAGALAGVTGAISALLGGAICAIPFALAGWLVTRRPADSAVSMVTAALWAEMVRIGLIALLFGGTLFLYRDVSVAAFISAFIAGVVILSLAVFIREPAVVNESNEPTTSHGRV